MSFRLFKDKHYLTLTGRVRVLLDAGPRLGRRFHSEGFKCPSFILQ